MTRNPDASALLESDGTLVGGWASIPSPATAELLAIVGHDFVVVDVEHTPMSFETVANMLRAIEAAPGETRTVVRVADGDRTTVNRTADLGPDVVLVPRVETASQAERIVGDLRFPPDGTRGIGPSRASEYGQNVQEHVQDGDDAVRTHVQLESEAAVDNATEITAVDGVDGVFVGPMDLSMSLDCFGDWSDDRFRAAVDSILTAADDAGVVTGTFATDADERAGRWEWDVDYLVGGVDLLHVAEGATEAVEHAAALREESPGES